MGGRPEFMTRFGGAILAGILLAGTCPVARAEEASAGSPGPVASRMTAAASARKSAKKPRRVPKLFQPTIVHGTPHLLGFAQPAQSTVGTRVLVTIRLEEGTGAPRSASFHIGADPAVVRFVGAMPTGRGALVVQPTSAGGELVVYRSSLPDGFSPAETLVELEFDTVGSGEVNFVLTDVRLFDARARDLTVTYDSANLSVQ
jgi:hypothetical protein